MKRETICYEIYEHINICTYYFVQLEYVKKISEKILKLCIHQWKQIFLPHLIAMTPLVLT